MNFFKTKHLSLAGLLLVCAILGLLAALALPARADDQQGYPRRCVLLTTQTLTNAQTATVNVITNLIAGSTYYSDYLTLWSTSQCTNTPVTGNTTVTWKFAWDLPSGTNTTGTNFQGGGTSVFVNNGQTVVPSYTNIPSIWWRGANAIEITTIVTAGQTNAANGSLIGQTTSYYLVQSK